MALTIPAAPLVTTFVKKQSSSSPPGPEELVVGLSLQDSAKLSQIRGVALNGSHAWLGVPYAEAPTGKLRFLPARPIGSWSGVRDASSYAAPCLEQSADGSSPNPLIPNASEDCECFPIL